MDWLKDDAGRYNVNLGSFIDVAFMQSWMEIDVRLARRCMTVEKLKLEGFDPT